MGSVLTPTLRQLLAAVSSGLLIAGLIASWGYPAAALPQMEQANSTIHFTPDQASWFATVTLFMVIPGSVIGSVVCEQIGPRRLFLILAPPFCIFFMLMETASWKVVQEAGASEILLLITRVGQASLAALMTPIVSIYTYEVSDRHMRGTLTGIVDFWCSFGIVLCYITGCFLSWETIALVLPLITVVPGFLGLLWSTESPHWLARKGKAEQARKVLNMIRNSEKEVCEELEATENLESKLSFCESLCVLAKRSNMLAIIASCGMLSMKELLGFNLLTIYIVHIFDAANVGMDPKVSSVVIGFVRIFCSGMSSFLLYRYPRKLLLICGNIVAAGAATAVGLFFYFQSNGDDISHLNWLPLLALTIHIIASCLVSSTSWVASVEVLPGPIRSVGFGITVMCYSTTAFITSKTFVFLQTLVGLHGVFWILAGGPICYLIFVICYVPETFGRSLLDIQDYWNHGHTKKKGTFV